MNSVSTLLVNLLLLSSMLFIILAIAVILRLIISDSHRKSFQGENAITNCKKVDRSSNEFWERVESEVHEEKPLFNEKVSISCDADLFWDPRFRVEKKNE